MSRNSIFVNHVCNFSPCASHRSLLIGYCIVLLTFSFVFKKKKLAITRPHMIGYCLVLLTFSFVFKKKKTRYYSQFSKASHRSLLIGYCFVLLTFFSVVNEYFPSGPLKPKHNFLRAKDSSKVAFRRVKNYVRLFRSGRRTSCTKIERKYA